MGISASSFGKAFQDGITRAGQRRYTQALTEQVETTTDLAQAKSNYALLENIGARLAGEEGFSLSDPMASQGINSALEQTFGKGYTYRHNSNGSVDLINRRGNVLGSYGTQRDFIDNLVANIGGRAGEAAPLSMAGQIVSDLAEPSVAPEEQAETPPVPVPPYTTKVERDEEIPRQKIGPNTLLEDDPAQANAQAKQGVVAAVDAKDYQSIEQRYSTLLDEIKMLNEQQTMQAKLLAELPSTASEPGAPGHHDYRARRARLLQTQRTITERRSFAERLGAIAAKREQANKLREEARQAQLEIEKNEALAKGGDPESPAQMTRAVQGPHSGRITPSEKAPQPRNTDNGPLGMDREKTRSQLAQRRSQKLQNEYIEVTNRYVALDAEVEEMVNSLDGNTMASAPPETVAEQGEPAMAPLLSPEAAEQSAEAKLRSTQKSAVVSPEGVKSLTLPEATAVVAKPPPDTKSRRRRAMYASALVRTGMLGADGNFQDAMRIAQTYVETGYFPPSKAHRIAEINATANLYTEEARLLKAQADQRANQPGTPEYEQAQLETRKASLDAQTKEEALLATRNQANIDASVRSLVSMFGDRVISGDIESLYGDNGGISPNALTADAQQAANAATQLMATQGPAASRALYLVGRSNQFLPFTHSAYDLSQAMVNRDQIATLMSGLAMDQVRTGKDFFGERIYDIETFYTNAEGIDGWFNQLLTRDGWIFGPGSVNPAFKALNMDDKDQTALGAALVLDNLMQNPPKPGTPRSLTIKYVNSIAKLRGRLIKLGVPASRISQVFENAQLQRVAQ